MEDRPRINNYDIDDSSEDDDDDPIWGKKTNKKDEVASRLTEIFKIHEEEEKPKNEKAEKNEKNEVIKQERSIDKNPELDTEAPVEDLSEAEIIEISKQLASERLEDISNEEYSLEADVAKQFLEHVVSSGDIEYSETEAEVTPIMPIGKELKINDPKSTGLEGASKITHRQSYQAEKKTKKTDGSEFLDFLLDRRKNRVKKSQKKKKELNKRLISQVEGLKKELSTSEKRVRKTAEKVYEIRKDNNLNEKNVLENPNENRNENKNRDLSAIINDMQKKTLEIQQLSSLSPENRLLKENIEDEVRSLPVVEVPVMTLSESQLKNIAKHIQIAESNLAKIYESHLITEKGLRRVVSVHLRGGNVKKALNRELLQRQIDFELDPNSRDRGGTTAQALAKTKEPSIDSLLEKKGINFKKPEPVMFDRANKKNSKKVAVVGSKKNKKTKLKIIDIVFVAVLLVLLFIALTEIIKK